MNSQHKSHPSSLKVAKRGRPKSAELSQRILDAAIEVLANNGYAEFSFVKVAEQAGSSRPAIYRRWPTKAALITQSLNKLMTTNLISPLDSPDIRQNIILILKSANQLLSNDTYRRAMASAMASAHIGTTNQELLAFLRSRRGIVIKQQLELGIAKNQLPKDFDIEFAIDALNGPIFFRSLIMDYSIPEDYPCKLVAAILPK